MERGQVVYSGYRVSVWHRMEFELGRAEQTVGRVSDPITSCLPIPITIQQTRIACLCLVHVCVIK